MKVQISKVDLYGGFKVEQKKSGQEDVTFWMEGQSSRDANIPANSRKKNQEDNPRKGQEDSHQESQEDNRELKKKISSSMSRDERKSEKKRIDLII